MIGNAAMMTDSNLIDVHDLPAHICAPDAAAGQQLELLSLDQVERRHALYVLEKVGGDKTRAAHILGISRNTLYSLLAREKEAAAVTS